MDNIQNLENECTVTDMENMELYNLVGVSVNFLNQMNNDAGEDYLSIAIAEGTIPKTRTPIKKFVLESYKDVLKKNYSVTKMNNPLYRLIYSNIDYDLAQPLLDYFEDEKQCLYTLKNFLECKASFPIVSFTGILTSTVIHIHNINIDKINTIIDISQNSKNSAFNVTLPDNYTTPYNHQFINEMDRIVNKFLVKTK